ncbi:MAG: helix-hairpin-helix domain-containing protein [Thermoguttaceae bacterium]|jgi:competence protein ComEA
MTSARNRPVRDWHWLLQRADQAVVAAIVLLCLIATFLWWVWQGGFRGRLIEVESAAARSADFQVDINQADWPELAELPGVGRALAERIVQSRRSQGPFLDCDDLRRVRGIGPKTLAAIRPYLRPMPAKSSLTGR